MLKVHYRKVTLKGITYAYFGTYFKVPRVTGTYCVYNIVHKNVSVQSCVCHLVLLFDLILVGYFNYSLGSFVWFNCLVFFVLTNSCPRDLIVG